MNCQREDELLDALGSGFIARELDAHVKACESCSELRTVAGALLDDRAGAIREAAVPTSASMWFRMQLRLRHDIATASRRSLLIGQALTLAIAIGLVALLFGGEVTVAVRHVVAAVGLPLLIAMAAMALLAPLAGFVVARK